MSESRRWMTTFTGLKINPLDPDPGMIVIEDIAHHLALECRYNGACKFHYSVAQHSILGAHRVSSENRLAFLLHDASEAYMHDLIHNVKYNIPFYREAEERLQRVIYEKFGVVVLDYREIKRVDYALMAAEAKALISDISDWDFPEPPLTISIVEWPWRDAEEIFLDNYYGFTGKSRNV